jgi:hypothetical protein
MSLLTRIADKFLDVIELGPSFGFRHWSFLIGRSSHRATVKGFRIHLRRGTTDAVIFRKIFRNGDWDLTRFPQAARVHEAYDAILRSGRRPVIIDAGANVGAASLWFARQFPSAAIKAVEPDPENARMCRLNTVDAANVTVIEAAIGAEPGAVSLSTPIGTADAVRTARAATGVPVRTVDELAKDGQLFLV